MVQPLRLADYHSRELREPFESADYWRGHSEGYTKGKRFAYRSAALLGSLILLGAGVMTLAYAEYQSRLSSREQSSRPVTPSLLESK